MPFERRIPAHLLALTACIASGCGESSRVTKDEGPASMLLVEASAPSDPAAPPISFVDVAAAAGLDFRHVSGMTAARYVPTANGSGVALFDYDGDGRLDVYFANGTFLPVGSSEQGGNRLYRNLGDGSFVDRTEAAGLRFLGYTHGALAGDVDNDGDADLFLCNYGPNALFLNQGDGTFARAGPEAGVDGPGGWSSSGAFLDYDADGLLDLYVAHYADWKLPEDDVFCGDRARDVRMYCMPGRLRTTRHALYRNEGSGRFTDRTEEAGIARSDGHGFGVVAADLNADGRIDLYVANDGDPNFLFLNRGDGTFEDATMTGGAALNAAGNPQSGMGVDAEDIDGDGLPDLFVTNFAGDYNTLYLNLGGGLFLDESSSLGLVAESLPWVGWGTALADFDGDAWPDLFVANAHIDDNRHLIGEDARYAQPALIYRNMQGRRFVPVMATAGPYFGTDHLGHGAAFGDLDDDGDLDVVVNHKDGPPALLRNETKSANRWIRLELVGTASNRDAVGARVEVHLGDRVVHRQRKGGSSLMSSHDPRLLIGVGKADRVDSITIRWPSGRVSRLTGPETNRAHRVVEPMQGSAPPALVGRAGDASSRE